MKKKTLIIGAFTPETVLKRKIRAHLRKLGFHKSADGALLPPSSSKDSVRALHFEQQREFVRRAPVLVQMLDGAANIVKLAHKVVVACPDEQLGPALELLLGPARGGQDQPVDATAILVNPVNNVRNRARLGIDVQGPEQTPVTARNQRRDYSIEAGDRAEAQLMGYRDPIVGQVETVTRGISVSNAAPSTQGLPNVDPVYTWVRLAQRVPVRIRITEVPAGIPLVSGMTVTVTIRGGEARERSEQKRSPLSYWCPA